MLYLKNEDLHLNIIHLLVSASICSLTFFENIGFFYELAVGMFLEFDRIPFSLSY